MQGQVNNQIWNGVVGEDSGPPVDSFAILTESGNDLLTESGNVLEIEH